MNDISTIILTYNEERHIARCIENAKKVSSDIFVVDSFSTDKTVEIAQSLGARVYQNKWENNYAKQFNWALANLPITSKWVLRLDADEYLDDILIDEFRTKVPNLPEDVTGVVFLVKMAFLGKVIHKGNVGLYLLRLFQYGKAESENRWMDEHIALKEGRSINFEGCFYNDNRMPLGVWIEKHNGYSIREAIDLLNIKYNFLPQSEQVLTPEAEAKRLKKKKYAEMPLFLRCFVYFIYRYVFKLGFTEGRIGFLWHFFQGWWYRTLVDAKVYEIENYAKGDVGKIKEFVKTAYKIEL